MHVRCVYEEVYGRVFFFEGGGKYLKISRGGKEANKLCIALSKILSEIIHFLEVLRTT